MNVKDEISKTIEVLKKLRKFKSQKDIALHLEYNVSYFSRAINEKEIPIDLEEKFFSVFPRSVYLSQYDSLFPTDNIFDEPYTPEPKTDKKADLRKYPPIEEQLIKVTDKKRKPKEGITPIEKDAYMWVEYQDLSAVAGRLGGANVDALPEHKKKLVPNEFDSGNYLVVRVDGDSMEVDSEISIPNGSEILIKEYIYTQGEKLPIRDNLWVIVSAEGTVFKQIIKHNIEQGFITVHSYNPRFEDYEIMMEDIIQLFIYRKIVSSRPKIPAINK